MRPSNAVQVWRLSEQQVLLSDDEIHVWRVMLDQPQLRVLSLFHTLAPEEKQRAERFHFQKDRDHFIVARGALRRILGMYLKRDPNRLQFCYSSYGKPYLPFDKSGDFRFNLSHSHGLALIAVSRSRELGIDVERVRTGVVEEHLAERFFSRREVTMLHALPAHQRVEAFFNCWTRKEAYIKARGEGLSLSLDMFDVSLAPGEPAALLETRIGAEDALRWLLVELVLGADFKAALVAEAQDWGLRCWQWPE